MKIRNAVKWMLAVVLVLVPAMSLTGCLTATSKTVPATLAPGALNQFDQTTYQTLAAAHAVALSASGNAKSFTPTQVTALNGFITALNVADQLYAAFHSGAATQSQMTAAMNTVSTSQATFTTAVTGVK